MILRKKIRLPKNYEVKKTPNFVVDVCPLQFNDKD